MQTAESIDQRNTFGRWHGPSKTLPVTNAMEPWTVKASCTTGDATQGPTSGNITIKETGEKPAAPLI